MAKKQTYPCIRELRLNGGVINSEKLGSSFDDLMWVKKLTM